VAVIRVRFLINVMYCNDLSIRISAFYIRFEVLSPYPLCVCTVFDDFTFM
jgi:hypothetical protein